MANDNLVRAILEMDVEASKLNKGLDDVATKITGTSKAFDTQKAKIQELINQEAKLISDRAKANNPSIVAKYNNKIKETQDQIKALGGAEKVATKEADNLGKALKNAFTGTQLAAMKKELKELGVEFSSVSSGAKKFLKDSKEGADLNTDAFKKLKEQIKLAKIELAEAFATGNQAKIQAASVKLGKLKDDFNNLSEAAKQFESNSKFTQISKSLGGITESILKMDFEKANKQSKTLLEISKSLTFAEAGKGVKDLGSALLNIGKSLLINPLFLLAATAVALWKSFDSFNESAKRTEEVLKGIDAAIKQIDEDTKALIRTNRDLSLQNQIDSKQIEKVNGEKLKAQNRFKDEYLAIVKKTQDAQKKLNEDSEKARDEDGFKLTKRIFTALGGETDLTKAQKEGLKGIQSAHNKEILELQKKFGLENSKILIDEANEQDKKNKEAQEKLKGFLQAEFNLRKSFNQLLVEADLRNTEFFNKERTKNGSNKQIELEFDARRNIAKLEFSAREEEINRQISAAKKEGLLTKGLQENFAKDRIIIAERLAQDLIQLNQEKQLSIINNDNRVGQESIERAKSNADLLLAQSEDAEISITRNRVLINADYYDALLKLAEKDIANRKALGFDTTTQEKALLDLKLKAQAESFKAFEELNKAETDLAVKQNDLKESQAQTQLKLKNSRHSTELDNEIKFERDKLTILEQGGKAYIEEAKRQADKVALLEKEAIKTRRLENIAYYEQLSQAAISTANKIIDVKIKELDTQTNLQQKRVDEAKGIADQGNAEMLELEKERLDNINKEKEKFVRAQQALAAIELISNTAIAVSKAAAEGGAAAGITIAAALLALVAGLASARSIASQAAFYDGGYTGDGNPRETSTALGRKPYTYHKGEFVFDHEKTGKYKEIFQGVHKGNIDLGQWKDKVQMFDYFSSLNSMNTQVPKFMPSSIVNNNIEITELKGQMSELIRAVTGQQTSVSLDKRGFAMSLKNVIDRDNFLSKEAKA